MVLDPEAATMFEGENCADMPLGSPVAVRVMAALKVEFGPVVSVSAEEAPAATRMEVAEGVRVNA